MIFNKFSRNIIIRLSLLMITMLLIATIFHRSDLMYSIVLLVVALIAQTTSLLVYITQTNNDLARFVNAMKDTDYTIKFPSAPNESFNKLHQSFQNLLSSYQLKEKEYEGQFLFIQQIIDHIDTGLLVTNDLRQIKVCNRTALHYRNHFRFGDDFTLLDSLDTVEDQQILEGKDNSASRIDLLVNKSSFTLLDEKLTIFTFKDISNSLEEKEIQSWQKLMRILAHEIINSLTPISSLSSTMVQMLDQDKDDIELSNVSLALQTIKDRSAGLLTFMENYRQLIKLPSPVLTFQPIRDTISPILRLMSGELEGIEVKYKASDYSFHFDKILLEQVVINLLKNSVQELNDQSDPCISISVTDADKYHQVQITDNGKGMSPSTLAKALIPFYTTKSDGSGIGLSLVHQVVNAHGGKVILESKAQEFTSIQLLFPKS